MGEKPVGAGSPVEERKALHLCSVRTTQNAATTTPTELLFGIIIIIIINQETTSVGTPLKDAAIPRKEEALSNFQIWRCRQVHHECSLTEPPPAQTDQSNSFPLRLLRLLSSTALPFSALSSKPRGQATPHNSKYCMSHEAPRTLGANQEENISTVRDFTPEGGGADLSSVEPFLRKYVYTN
eukprot:4311171-Amphidinium_carterae.1